jgi:hypothetical protein
MPALTSPEPVQVLASVSVSSSWRYFASLGAGLQRHFCLRAEAGRPRQECSYKLVAILAPTYKLALRRFQRERDPNYEINIALRRKQGTFIQEQIHSERRKMNEDLQKIKSS